MSKALYTKPSLSLRDQALRLRSRGLDAPAEKIELTLRRMSYYRLAGYLWWFYGEEWEVLEPGGLTPFCRSSRYESRPVARGRGQGDWSDHDEQQEASHPGAGRP